MPSGPKDRSNCHDFEDVIAWATEPDPAIVTGDHDIANRVRVAFDQLRGKIVADDWSASITTYLEIHDAARMRGDGRVYWVPLQRIEDIRKLGAFLQEVGIDLILCEIEPEVQTVVQDVAQVSIDEELDRLQEEATAFDGRTGGGTLTINRPRRRLVGEDFVGTVSTTAQVIRFSSVFCMSLVKQSDSDAEVFEHGSSRGTTGPPSRNIRRGESARRRGQRRPRRR